jgi:carbonic anhydrase/acetyltransferase-like protein (isoleucine patch superfamily)
MIIEFERKQSKMDATAFIAENVLVIGDIEIGLRANIWFYSIV